MRRFLLTTAAACALATVSVAGTQEAETCLRTKVWDGYADGWGIRTMTSTSLAKGKTRNYLVTLYKGNEYRIETCGDEDVRNVDVLLYDTQGNVVKRDDTIDREPKLEFSPEETGTYYIVLYQRDIDVTKDEAGVAMAVVYR